jgi:hypothetical protein
MDSPSPKPFRISPGAWVVIAAVLLLNAWYDYYHPRGIITDVIIGVVLLVVYFKKSGL